MPKQITLADELASLHEAGEDSLRQYVTRVTAPTAKKFIADCIDQNQQPAHRLRAIMEGYYNGETITLSPNVAFMLTRLSLELGRPLDLLVQELLIEFGMEKLKKVRSGVKA